MYLFVVNSLDSPVKANETSVLHVTITGLKNNSGNVHIALYDKSDKFPQPDEMIVGIKVSIYKQIARHSFVGLDHKYYAIAIYPDMNDNNSFDQGFLGVSLVDFAFSNNAKVFFEPPSFSEAAF